MSTPPASNAALQKWGGLASFIWVAAMIVASLIYLMGNLRAASGPFTYALADLLYGPVWAASLITGFSALRERLGEHTPRRIALALLAAILAAGMMVLVACIRAANRHYHLIHPDLHLESSTSVLVVWTTLVAGVTGAGWHFLGWALILIGSATWASTRFPRALCILYLAGGIAALFVYAFPDLEGLAGALGITWSMWQGIILWKGASEEAPLSENP